MKKIFISLGFLLLVSFTVFAQRSDKKNAAIKAALIEKASLTDEEATSVMAIEEEYSAKWKAVNDDTNLLEEDKRDSLKSIENEEKGKWEALVGEEKAGIINTYYVKLKKTETAENEKKGSR